jgi:general secretion pathway protein L
MRLEALLPFAPTLSDAAPKLQRLLRPAREFLSWWSSELRACVPPRLRGILVPPGQVIELVVADGAAMFSRRRGSRSEELARIGLARHEEAQARRALTNLRRQIQPKRSHVHLGIAAGQVLRRTIDLPVSVVENLREVLELELDRHTPFRPAEVYFDHRIAGFDDGGRRVLVELAVVQRRLADRALSIARALGYPPERVGIAGEDGIDFLRAEGDGEFEGQAQSRAARIGIAVGVVLLLVLPWLALKMTQTHEEVRMTQMREQAAQTDALRKEVQVLLARNRSLPMRKQTGPTLMSVLEELANILPDGTWVAELRLDGPKLSLVGYSGSASALIAVIEESALFSQTEFASPMMPDPTLHAERFHIVATVGGK